MDRVALKHWGWFVGIGAAVCACSTESGSADTARYAGGNGADAALDCEVAIVGGGPGGVHTAYKLTNPPSGTEVTGVTSGRGVCLFEKNDRLGGRFRDVSFGPNPDDVYGTGGYRLYDSQYTAKLASELAVTTAEPFEFATLRGLQDPGGTPGRFFAYSADAFETMYGQTENDEAMWVRLMCGDQVPKDESQHPNYAAVGGGIAGKSSREYVQDVLGDQGARFFFDNSRFRADFVDEVDAIGYLEYAVIDWFGSGATKYPIPGHSAMINEMRAAIEAKGGRIFLSEPVSSVVHDADGRFKLTTEGHEVKAKQVVLAVPQGALGKITGDVITEITEQIEYASVTSAKSMQVSHQWDKAWWKSDLRYPAGSSLLGEQLAAAADGGKPILRADTTIMPDGYCINAIEMPPTPHHDALKVTRTVYSDDRTCVDKNLMLYGAGGATGEQALNDELLRILRILFPNVFDGSDDEPKITKTDVNVHDEAWFYLKKGATRNGVTNQSIFDWSSNPIPDESVYLVGDSWYPLGSGWGNAAYISSIRVLNDHFGFSAPSEELEHVACPPL